ncbi:hypothetical protein [Flavobacterium sp. LHD-85]|uniref:hypothetical protein n=1 Tax=Flavobacterium sp. LHD-85 TaxID=3071410 RepID=UPI0027DF2C52|nr:hypothetical protein [Flavobacterium sp. LHD-85]MDQ6531507.1 hypothetical protein [Flavobacterium sp. LHD-85]
MKKNLFCMWLLLLALFFSVNTQAQMTIGGKKAPEPFSVLELLNKGGLRLPQMTTAQRNAFAVQGNAKGEGLTIYNSDTKCVEYWNATRWVSLCEGTSQTTISPQPCINVPADGTGCTDTFTITDPDCPNGPFSIAIVAGGDYAALTDVDNVNGNFKINFYQNETVNIHTVLVRVTSTCTSLYKEFLFSQNGVDCGSMPYAVPIVTASGTSLCAGGSVYLSVPANTANLDKLIWTRNGIEVARGVNYYIATQAGKYNISMGAVGCNTNVANERNITNNGTITPVTLNAIAENNGVICGGNQIELSASGNSSGTIVWFQNGVEKMSGAKILISGDSNLGEWFAAVKDQNCYSNRSNILIITKSTGSGQITVPDADVLVNGKALNTFTSFCEDGSLDLSIANPNPSVTYTWYNGSELITTNPFVIPKSQTKLSLRMIASDNSGAKCPAESHVLDKNIVSGNTPAQPSITGNTLLCNGSTDLTVVPAVDGSYTYAWYKDGEKMDDKTSATITVREGGEYSASVTNSTGCTSVLTLMTVSSTVSNIPTVKWEANPATATFGATVTLQVSATFTPKKYTWTADNDATVIGTGESVAIQLPASGADGLKIKVTVTAENDCGKSVPLEHFITLNNACPTPVVAEQTSVSQNILLGATAALTVAVTNGTSVGTTYQWYSNTSTSTTGGTVINGATLATYSYKPTAVGKYYFYCVVKNSCSGTTVTSQSFTITVTSIDSLGPGGLLFSGKQCFDVAETDGAATDCGTLASRAGNKSDFNVTNKQTYTLIVPTGTSISNVRFVYIETVSGQIVEGITGDNPASNIRSNVTCTVTFKKDLSSAAGVTGKAKGRTAANALTFKLYAIYTASNGKDYTTMLPIQVRDCNCCGAMVSATEWRNFACFNLGVTTAVRQTANPLVAIPTTKGLTYTFNGNTTNWYQNGRKSSTDPCPANYRVPTLSELQGMVDNNVRSLTGSQSVGNGGVMVGSSLMLPYVSTTSNNPIRYLSSTPVINWYASGLYNNNGGYTSTLVAGSYGAAIDTDAIRCIAIPDSEK